MKFLIALSLFITSSISQAYQFKFDYDNAFVPTEKVRQRIEAQAEIINKYLLNANGLNMKITSVVRDWNSVITGEVEGINCSISTTQWEEISANQIPGDLLMGHTFFTLRGAGFIFLDNRRLLIPQCLISK